MVDTTKDIWNDPDDEGLPKKKSHRGRQFLIFFLTLAVVLGVVLVAAYRDGTGFDLLRRYWNYGGSTSVDSEGIYRYESSAHNRFAVLGDHLVVLSDTALRILDQEGGEVWSATVNMASPTLHLGGNRAVAYDVGGTELYVLDREGEVLHLTAGEEEPFIAATLNEAGWLAVTMEKRGYKGCVTVYNAEQKEVFAFRSAKRFVADAYVTDDNRSLAAVTLGQEGGIFISNMVLYNLKEQTEEPRVSYAVKDGLVVEISQQGNQLVTVSDTCMTFADLNGQVKAEYPYGGSYLRGYDTAGNGFAVLLLNRYQSGSVGRLVTVGPDGTEMASLDVNQEILGISAAGRYLAVLYANSLVIYNADLQVYASLQGTDFASNVLMREDGSALLLSAEYAGIFLP